MSQTKEYVVKRNGKKEEFNPNKVLFRIKNMCVLDDSEAGKDHHKVSFLKPLSSVNYDKIARQVISRIYDGITTSELDDIAASLVAPLGFEHPEYEDLSSRILVSNHHKSVNQYLCDHFGISSETLDGHGFYYTCRALWENVDQNGYRAPLIAPHVMSFVTKNRDKLEPLIQKSRDYLFKYAGFIKLYDSYLLRSSLFKNRSTGTYYKKDGKYQRFVVEIPQYMWLRVALGIYLPCPGNLSEDPIMQYKDQYDAWKLAKLKKTESMDMVEKVLMLTSGNTINDDPVEFWEDLLTKCDTAVETEHFEKITTAYEMLSSMRMTHATPTLFHAGGIVPQLSSCFLTTVPYDSMDSISDYWKRLAMIAKWAGGLGSHVHHIRSSGSYIAGTGGTSNGLPKMLKVVNEIALYVDQGGNKRPGSHALYLEPWHGDIVEFLDLKRSRGNMEKRAKSLFYAMWLNDEFMRCVEQEDALVRSGVSDPKLWYLMDPTVCPGLSETYDQNLRITWIDDLELDSPGATQKFAFTYLYRYYVKKGAYLKNVSAREIWKQIGELTQETGIPYKLHKDAINRKNNQSNLGVIKSSNLCCEITEYSNSEETAVCNLASICLSEFVVYDEPKNGSESYPINTDSMAPADLPKRGWFDFEAFSEVVYNTTINLNYVIDNNYYPIPSTRLSNERHRPIGLGVQGLADVFSKLWLPFGSPGALALDAQIFECMYFSALRASCELAASDGHYSSFPGSWASKGVLQFDLWAQEHIQSDRIRDRNLATYDPFKAYPVRMNWTDLKENIKKYGLRNSLLVAPMPTASTSTIMGNSPAFEPHNALIYKRSDKHGEANVCNRDLQNALIARGLWTVDVQNALMGSRIGSIAEIASIPREIRDIFKTAFELSPKAVINHALARAPYVDQSMSMNLFVAEPSHKIITQMHFYSWKRGIKTGGYYLRRLPPADAKKLQLSRTVDEPEVYGDVCLPGCDSCGA